MTVSGINPAGFKQFALIGNGYIGLDATILRNTASTLRIGQANALKTVYHAPRGKGLLVPTKRTAGTLVGQTGSIDLRTSVVGDGTAYNGNAPQVMLRANPALGIAADTVLATMAGSAGAWNATAITLPVPTNDGAYEIVVSIGGVASPTGWVNAANLTAA